MMDYIAECQEGMSSPADCARSLIQGGWRIHGSSKMASELLVIAKMILSYFVSDCCGARIYGSRVDPICSECREHCEAVEE